MDEFERLQQKLIDMWKEIGTKSDVSEYSEPSIVVVPSMSVDIEFPGPIQQAYEERMLFLLYLLRQPWMHIIYVTSQVIRPEIIEYYLGTLPGMVSSSAHKRLTLISPEDSSPRPLSRKLLDRPELVKQIKAAIPDIDQAHMVPFLTTDLERDLALVLGIPMYAADPRFFAFGTKSGCRRLFAEEGVQHPLGYEDLFSVDAVVAAILKMRSQKPSIGKVVVKLNEGVSGIGNAIVELNGLPAPGAADEAEKVRGCLLAMQLEAGDITLESYLAALEKDGAIVEEFISGEAFFSPSVQLRVTPLGEVEVLSTHDQMLGGPSGQSYMGAIFPADRAYSQKIVRDAVKVGERLAKEGIVGRFALDFIVVRQPGGVGNAGGEWDAYAIEINLRKGGTTAPYLILEYLTYGSYNTESGLFKTAQGQEKYYVASDHVESEAYRGFTINHLFDLVSNYGLHYNHATQTGVIMHMLTGVGEFGRVGVTAIENTPEKAAELYQRFVKILNEEAEELYRGE